MLWRFQNFATFAGRKNLIPREAATLWWIGYAIPTLFSRLQTTREHRINQPKVIKNSKAPPPPRHNREANDNHFTERQLNSVHRMIQNLSPPLPGILLLKQLWPLFKHSNLQIQPRMVYRPLHEALRHKIMKSNRRCVSTPVPSKTFPPRT